MTRYERAEVIYNALTDQTWPATLSKVEYIRQHLEEVVVEDRAARAIPGSEMTPERLAEIQERANLATEGLWERNGCAVELGSGGLLANFHCSSLSGKQDEANASFVAATRQDVPDLLAYISYLEALIRDGLASGELAAWEAGRQSAFVEVAKRPPSSLSSSG